MDPNIPESVTENLYKQNLELAVKNKTLLLLKQLYQISILSLEPEVLATKIVETVREVLEFEIVGIFTLNQTNKSLVPLKLSLSERIKNTGTDLQHLLENSNISDITTLPFFEKILQNIPNHTENITDIWRYLIPDQILNILNDQSHIKSIVAYPLIINGTTTGIFIICLNRPYEKLSQYEGESLESLVDVTAIALDRAKLYQELKVANEKLRELDQMKSEFLSLATHQIRAPLTAIKGYSSMLLEGDFGVLPEKAKEAASIVLTSSQNLINIVGDFLDISRIEQGRMVYNKSIFEVTDLLLEVTNSIKPNIVNAGLTIDLDIGNNDSAKINADRDKIKQVVGNIIDNATKYTLKGGIVISIKLSEGKVLILIKDTGVGIDPAEISKLFNKFSRTKDANKTNVIGTGLGLYIAKKMVEAHNGDIKVASDGLGKGTTFTIELPRYQ